MTDISGWTNKKLLHEFTNRCPCAFRSFSEIPWPPRHRIGFIVILKQVLVFRILRRGLRGHFRVLRRGIRFTGHCREKDEMTLVVELVLVAVMFVLCWQ